MADLGLYIHFPYCRKRCPYCDFAIAVAREVPHERYLAAILDELAARAPAYAGRRLVSIYLGGGTPSLWATDCVATVIERAIAVFAPERPLEVTLEANPTDCTAANLSAWQRAGVNRISIGVQSTQPSELVALGRDHRFGDGPAAVRAALAAGVPRLSADVILGVPGREREPDAPDPSVLAMADLDPGHLSVYELTVEPRTALGAAVARGDVTPLDDEVLAAQYIAVDAALQARGYEHYEISSYARPGHRAVHNTLYWCGGEYLGLGNGAASFRRTGDGGVRETNLRAVGAYLDAPPAQRVAETTPLSAAELASDLIWLGMRTRDGIPAAYLDERPALWAWLEAGGLAERAGNRIRPTLRGFLFADRVADRVVGNPG